MRLVHPFVNAILQIIYVFLKPIFHHISSFEIRFHLNPLAKVTKTQDGDSVLIELENSGWRFFCKDSIIDIETGLFFGKKNSYIENQNIFISGITKNEDQTINWEISKI